MDYEAHQLRKLCVGKVSLLRRQHVQNYSAPVCAESVIKRVLKRGTSSESRALIEYDRSCFFALPLIRELGSIPL